MNVKGTVCIITGGGTGVGRAIALKLANQGWRVAIIGRRIEALEETQRLAGPAASAITTHGCDVGSSDSVAATGKQILEQFGDVDPTAQSTGWVRIRSLPQPTYSPTRSSP